MGLPFDLENAVCSAERAIEKAHCANGTLFSDFFAISEDTDEFEKMVAFYFSSAYLLQDIVSDYIIETMNCIKAIRTLTDAQLEVSKR